MYYICKVLTDSFFSALNDWLEEKCPKGFHNKEMLRSNVYHHWNNHFKMEGLPDWLKIPEYYTLAYLAQQNPYQTKPRIMFGVRSDVLKIEDIQPIFSYRLQSNDDPKTADEFNTIQKNIYLIAELESQKSLS